MPRIDTIVIGASAGGIEALSTLAEELPADFAATILVVSHFPEDARSVLPHILGRHGPLPAEHAISGTLPLPGHIYVAPPGRHMLLRHGKLMLLNGAKENRNRPAIDPLFRSAARARGAALAGVLLSGMLTDGSLGLAAIHRWGGLTIVQSLAEAAFPDMPRNAMQRSEVDYALPVADIARMLTRLCAL